MSVRLLHSDLWSTITNLAKNSKRKHVAVAYLGSGAYKLLPMRRGDSLVVDMSDHAVSGGQTSPDEIQKYFDKGVDVYTHSKLHAKMFIFDNVVIVGSANASQRSKNVLEEVALLCRDREVLIRARGIVRGFQRERVTQELLKQQRRIYSTSKRPETRGGKKEEGWSAYSPLWVVGMGTVENIPKIEERFLRAEKAKAKRKLTDPKKNEPNWFRYPPTIAKFYRYVAKGDLVVQIVEDEGKVEVYPPCRVIHVKRYPRYVEHRKGWKVVYLEQPKDPQTKTWQELKNKVAKAYSRINIRSSLEIRDEETKERILGMWD